MSRVVATLCLRLVVGITIASTGCVVVAVPLGVPTSEPMPPPEEDHTAAIIGGVVVGIAVTTVVAILLKRARSSAFSSPDAPEEPVAISQDLRDKFARGFVAAQQNDCVTALAIDTELSREAPSFRARYVIEPAVAACRH